MDVTMDVQGFSEETRKSWQTVRRCEVVLHKGMLCVTCRERGNDRCFFVTEGSAEAGMVCQWWLEGCDYTGIMEKIEIFKNQQNNETRT